MEKLDRNFADFLKSLNAHGVEYLVVGGYAVGYHGFVRATGGLDVFVRLSQRNAEKLIAAFTAKSVEPTLALLNLSNRKLTN